MSEEEYIQDTEEWKLLRAESDAYWREECERALDGVILEAFGVKD